MKVIINIDEDVIPYSQTRILEDNITNLKLSNMDEAHNELMKFLPEQFHLVINSAQMLGTGKKELHIQFSLKRGLPK